MTLRILLIASQFPPTNATGARRPYYLARQLRDAGHIVTVLTSLRDEEQPWSVDMEGMHVHRFRTPSTPPWFTSWQGALHRAATRSRGGRGGRAIGLLAELLLPLDHLHRWDPAPEVLEELVGEQDVVVATGPLWSMVQLGGEMARRCNATFIADYRDPWTIALPEVGLHVLTYMGPWPASWSRRMRHTAWERRATREASFTAATKGLLKNALLLNGERPALQVYNGAPGPATMPGMPKNPRFTLVYTGSVYREQEWDLVLRAVDLLERDHPEVAGTSRLLVVGMRTAHDSSLSDLGRRMDQRPTIERQARLGREEVLGLQQQADLLLHVGFGEKQVLPLKLFEYIASGRPIAQVGSGLSEQVEIIERTRTGTTLTTPEAFVDHWLECHTLWQAGEAIPFDPDKEAIAQFTWEVQMERFHQFILERHAEKAGISGSEGPGR